MVLSTFFKERHWPRPEGPLHPAVGADISALDGRSFDASDVVAAARRAGLSDPRVALRSAARVAPRDGPVGPAQIGEALRREASPSYAQLQGGVPPAVAAAVPDYGILDAAMWWTGVADVQALLLEAEDSDGNGALDLPELMQAGQSLGAKMPPDIAVARFPWRAYHGAEQLAAQVRAQSDGSPGVASVRAADILAEVPAPWDLCAIDAAAEAALAVPGTAAEHDAASGLRLLSLPSSVSGRPNVWLSGFGHGHEPGSGGAMALFLRRWCVDPSLRAAAHFWVVPVAGRRAASQGTRRTPENIDYNRDFGEKQSPEARALSGWLDRVRAPLVLDAHSGATKRRGFWVYSRGQDDFVFPAVQAFSRDWPLEPAGRKGRAPGWLRSTSSATLKDYAVDAAGAEAALTLEAPGAVAYLDQVFGLEALLRAQLFAYLGR